MLDLRDAAIPADLEPWRRRAACRHLGTDMFFPPGESDRPTIDAAVAVCRSCPVSDACLDYSLRTNQQMGIWGGLTARQRRSLRRKMRRRDAI